MNINHCHSCPSDVTLAEVADTPVTSGPLSREDMAHRDAVRVALLANGDPFGMADDGSLPPF